MSDGPQLLAEYVKNGSETAFRELVSRYVDLVYSSAVRLVNGDTHRAEDVTQTVFADLARLARTLSRDVMLGGWLHRHTCFVASKTMRGERRRQHRERQAVEMSSIDDHSEANLGRVAPVLDEAINQLGSDDRQAILLRFFEQRDYRSLGEAIGSNEEAARKRVHRALDKLHVLLNRRGVALSAAALDSALSAQGATTAPAGLAAGVAASALAGAASGTTTALTLLNIMSTTKLKIGIISAIAAAVAIPLVMQYRTQTRLREENEALRRKAIRIEQLAAENTRLSNRVAQSSSSAPEAGENGQFREILKLRGEVAKLRQNPPFAEPSAPPTNAPSALSALTASPEMHKLIRDQQKVGLTMVYKVFAKNAKLAPEQAEKLNDLLADNVMENIDRITAVLREGRTPAQSEQVFAEQEAILLGKVQALLGPDALAQYQDYTRNLGSHLTAEQFKSMLTGEKELKNQQSQQLFQLMQEETRNALASAGLGPDFQTVPTLNFRNFASEEESEKNLKLLDSIYEQVAARAGSFLSPAEVEKFGQFRTNAINANRMGLVLNRKMMAPAKQ